MNHTLHAHEQIDFINAFAPRRNRTVRKRCRELRHAAISRDLDGIRAEAYANRFKSQLGFFTE